MARVTGHCSACKSFIINSTSKSGCVLFYEAVNQYGWDAFQLAVLVLPNASDLQLCENTWLALKLTLNSMHVANGALRHSPESIQSLKDSLGSGPSHHSYGVQRTTTQKHTSMLSSVNRVPLYQYTPDSIYTGLSFESIKEASWMTGMHIDKLSKYMDTSALLAGHLYSTQSFYSSRWWDSCISTNESACTGSLLRCLWINDCTPSSWISGVRYPSMFLITLSSRDSNKLWKSWVWLHCNLRLNLTSRSVIHNWVICGNELHHVEGFSRSFPILVY